MRVILLLIIHKGNRMDSNQEKFQKLLRELFQFDCADLDFGIYRIMNHKRDVIEKFIVTDLPETINEELGRGMLAGQAQAAKELADIAGQIRENLGPDAIDADGRLAEMYHDKPLGKKYLDLKAKASGGRGHDALESGIYNHLYSFFSRYYQDGDFISKRRYSKRQKYAVPYNGEEVYLHWANRDQYYIKTAEYFHDYSFVSHGVTVHFKLKAADVEQNNVKGDKRFFLPLGKDVEWDESSNRLAIPFEYRPLTEQEDISLGKKNQQDAIIANALADIPKRLKKADKAVLALTAERRKNSEGQSVTFFEHHLRQYARRNTSDFFIHKDLKGFLSTELDFYLKNEVLNLDEMEAAGEDRAEGWFQTVRVIKAVGGGIIDFLDQIENFQKMLWEKRKFITETQYCITMGNINEKFYPEIAICEAQWDEWKDLFHIDEEKTDLFTAGKSKKDRRITFLKSHPTLVLDTKNFDQGFIDRLFTGFDDLDETTDGLLLNSENFQALNILLEKYREKVTCIHIDPPYNTQTSGFIYKNDYQHSSWLSMM
jgi:adenine-specific DNA-methyltransferase